MLADRRLLLVHAHPDDETINNGATMAHYAAAGADVTLLTCTLGEFGEILVPSLAELEWDKGDQLGGYRMLELEQALHELGVTDHRFLGGAGRFHDSGMMGTPGNDHPRAFWRASTSPAVFAGAVRAAAEVIRERRPQVLVTYDENGGYGHPDHIMANRVSMAAVDAAADPGFDAAGPVWPVAKVYCNVASRSSLQRALDAVPAGATGFVRVETVDDFPFVADDADVTTSIDGRDHIAAKTAALRAHATQISVEGTCYALSNQLGLAICGTEEYRLVRGDVAGPYDSAGHETDLFAGAT